jgi:hypothetical protein
MCLGAIIHYYYYFFIIVVHLPKEWRQHPASYTVYIAVFKIAAFLMKTVI